MSQKSIDALILGMGENPQQKPKTLKLGLNKDIEKVINVPKILPDTPKIKRKVIKNETFDVSVDANEEDGKPKSEFSKGRPGPDKVTEETLEPSIAQLAGIKIDGPNNKQPSAAECLKNWMERRLKEDN
ncbi:hypothetical protein SNE40_019608 [Patella caerulea]|uniref:Uncharacterized protein n=1 Tax=Patella caerulea TaxID=87958 RepID=A0AAN8J7S5_PATCE